MASHRDTIYSVGASNANGDSVAAKVRALLSDNLSMGYRVAAAALGVHPRTMERRLIREGTCLEAIKDEVRRDIALYYLTKTSSPLTEVASIIRYSDVTSLSRSCKRWFRCSPRGLREQARQIESANPALNSRRNHKKRPSISTLGSNGTFNLGGRGVRPTASTNERRESLSERAYSHIKHLLVSGEISGEGWLPIDVIAAELKVSRQPVMDAIRRLSIEGFVEVVPQVGCRARRPESSEIKDLLRLLAEGEALVAELAAARADTQDVFSLRLISSQIGLLSQQTDLENAEALYHGLNRRLHAEIRRAARSPSLTEIVEGLGERFGFLIALPDGQIFFPNLAATHAEHEEIIDAIAQGSRRKARSAMKHHLSATENRLQSTLR